MAKDLREGEFRLPSDFLCDDFLLEQEELDATKQATNLDSPAETENDEEEDVYLAGLTRQMAAHCCFDGGRSDASVLTANSIEGPKSGVTAGSLQSPSLVSLPLPAMSPLEQQEDLNDRGGVLTSQRKTPPAFPAPCDVLSHQQRLQAAQFHQPKQPQLMRQQLFAAWARQSKARGGMGHCGRPMGLSPSACRPLQKQQQPPQPGSGMRAVFLSRPGTRRESAGTGVFLPRAAGDKYFEAQKKPPCSTVLVPERVIQALNLNLEVLGGNPHIVLDHDALPARRNAVFSHQKRSYHPRHGTADATHEIGLPQEWTY